MVNNFRQNKLDNKMFQSNKFEEFKNIDNRDANDVINGKNTNCLMDETSLSGCCDDNLGQFLETSNLFQTFCNNNSLKEFEEEATKLKKTRKTKEFTDLKKKNCSDAKQTQPLFITRQQNKLPYDTFQNKKEEKEEEEEEQQQQQEEPEQQEEEEREYEKEQEDRACFQEEKHKLQDKSKEEKEVFKRKQNVEQEENKSVLSDYEEEEEEEEEIYDAYELQLENDCKEIEQQLASTLNKAQFQKKGSLINDEKKKSSKINSYLLGGPSSGSYGVMKRKELERKQLSSNFRKMTIEEKSQQNYDHKNTPLFSNISKDAVSLQLFAAQAQAKLATVTQQIQRLRQLEEELVAKNADLDYEKAQFETFREQQRLKFIAERESLMLEIEEEKNRIQKKETRINCFEPQQIELVKQRDQLEDDNRKLRVKLAQLMDEFSGKEERYHKLVQRLGNQVFNLEKKNKSLLESVHELEQASFQLNNRLNRVSDLRKKQEKPMAIKSLSTRSKSATVMNNNQKNNPKFMNSKFRINEKILENLTPRNSIPHSFPNLNECRRRIQRHHSEENIAKNCIIDDSSSEISHVSSQQTVPCAEQSKAFTKSAEVSEVNSTAYIESKVIEKNPLPQSNYKDILDFVLQIAWKPFDDAIYSLKNAAALKQAHSPIKKPDGRLEIVYCDGHKEITFINGMRKIICPNGWIFNFLTNGDIRGTNSLNFTYYYYHKDTIYSITTPDGRVFTTFSDGQIDCKLPSGKTQVRFPQGILKQIDENGNEHIQYIQQA